MLVAGGRLLKELRQQPGLCHGICRSVLSYQGVEALRQTLRRMSIRWAALLRCNGIR